MCTIKDRNSRDIEVEEIKKRWKKYIEELYKKDLNDLYNHDGMVSHPEPDILEYEVKWTLGSTAVNKASGCDGIPAELFKTLKNDESKCYTQYVRKSGRPSRGHREGSILIPIPKKGSTKECSNNQTLALISHASKFKLKILHSRLQH